LEFKKDEQEVISKIKEYELCLVNISAYFLNQPMYFSIFFSFFKIFPTSILKFVQKCTQTHKGVKKLMIIWSEIQILLHHKQKYGLKKTEWIKKNIISSS